MIENQSHSTVRMRHVVIVSVPVNGNSGHIDSWFLFQHSVEPVFIIYFLCFLKLQLWHFITAYQLLESVLVSLASSMSPKTSGIWTLFSSAMVIWLFSLVTKWFENCKFTTQRQSDQTQLVKLVKSCDRRVYFAQMDDDMFTLYDMGAVICLWRDDNAIIFSL